MKTKLWLDDERPAPDDTWQVFKTAPSLIGWLHNTGCVRFSEMDGAVLSLDHDLGPPEAGTGYDVVCFLEELFFNEAELGRTIPDLTLEVHSANPIGRTRMQQGILSIRKLRQQQVGGG